MTILKVVRCDKCYGIANGDEGVIASFTVDRVRASVKQEGWLYKPGGKTNPRDVPAKPTRGDFCPDCAEGLA